MVLLGGEIANFAELASESLDMIKGMINKMKKFAYNSPEYNKEKFAAQKRLVDLQAEAEKSGASCRATVDKLTEVNNSNIHSTLVQPLTRPIVQSAHGERPKGSRGNSEDDEGLRSEGQTRPSGRAHRAGQAVSSGLPDVGGQCQGSGSEE
jgi:hypothetical protein